MEELLFDSIESAAECINGDLKKTVLRQFIKLINPTIPIQDSVSDFAFAAVFVATVYQGSTEDERKTLSKQITKEVLVISELVKALNMFWKRGQSVKLYADKRLSLSPPRSHSGMHQ